MLRCIKILWFFLTFVVVFGQALDVRKIAEQSKPDALGVSGSAIQSGASQMRNEIEKLKQAQEQASQRLGQLQYTPLDGVIDGDKYLLGPHDIIRIQVWTAATIDEMLEVSPDGMVVISGYGAIEVGGLNWNDGKQVITDAIMESYNPERFAVTIAAVRIFWTNITGAVEFPGSYQIGATQRLFDLIQLAGGANGIADISNIKVFKKNGDTVSIDLTPYFAEGSIDANPYIFDGDVVFVPQVSAEYGTIQLYGAGIRNGYYGLNPGETVMQIAQRIGVFTQSLEFTGIQVVRGDDVHSVNLLASDFALNDNDVVIFPAHLDSIIVGGLVTQGGAFPYYPGVSVYAYIAMASGPDADGSENRYSIFRNGKEIKFKAGDNLHPGDVIIVHHSIFTRVKDFVEAIARVVSSSITVYYLIDRLTK